MYRVKEGYSGVVWVKLPDVQRLRAINLSEATQKELKLLASIGHPAVEEIKKKPE